MSQQCRNASGNTEWSLFLGEPPESHDIATCLTQAVSPPTSATLSGRVTPTGGLHDLHDPREDECAEDEGSVLVSLGEELVPLIQTDEVNQRGEEQERNRALVLQVPPQRPNTPL